ncbi:MAG: DegT/DnrJ/EryC1/StrS family aminotransferase [Actinomycetes bacterium]
MTTPELIDPLDPLGLRGDAPLLDGYLSYLESEVTPLHTPGHKTRTKRMGAVLQGDVTLYGGVDTIRGRHGRLEAAESKAAQLWGGDWCRFSVAGSTHANQALSLGVGAPGDTVIVSRMLHRSLLLGMVLAGLKPVWVTPDIDPHVGLPVGVRAERVAAALERHPEAKAVFLVDPSYVGTVSHIEDHADVVHAYGIPLVVDQAWGGHFGFHPDVPPHALQLGADALVTSVHKALTGYTQSALVVARSERFDIDRLERAFDATHTTSPAGQIVGSIDATRALLARDGRALLEETVRICDRGRDRLRSVDGLQVVDASVLPPGTRFDPTKIVLGVSGTGADGVQLDDDLSDAGFPIEYSDRDTVVATLSIFDDEIDVDGFVAAFEAALESRRGPARTVRPHVAWTVEPETVVRPRDAFFAQHETVSADDAVGRVSAEIVAPYPPGVPVLAPGERVTAETLKALRDVKADGALVRYAADPSLGTLQVVVE